MDLNQRVVVITGGGSGIGAAMGRRFAAAGARAVVLADMNLAGAQGVAEGIGPVASARRCDVSQEADLVALIEDTESRLGPIDLFCSNAGISARGGVDVADAEWQRAWDVNLMAHVWAARALVPRMLAQGGGYLLQTASAAGLLSQFEAPYAVTKHAAVALAEWLSITHGPQGLKVSCLCPLGVDTPMLQGETEARREAMSDGLLSAEAVAEAVLQGIQKEQLLILPHPQVADFMLSRAKDHERWLRGMRHFHAVAREA